MNVTALVRMNEKYIVSGGEKEVKMWDLRTGQMVKKFKGHKSNTFTSILEIHHFCSIY